MYHLYFELTDFSTSFGALIESVLTRIELMKAINFSELFTLANYHGRVILNSMRIFWNIGVVADL